MHLRSPIMALLLATLFAPLAFSQDQGTQSAQPQPSQTLPPNPISRIRVGANVASASITHLVQPAYPPIAKSAHISGTVVLHAIIAKDGTVQDLQVVSGPPLLIKAAMDAVKQWVYKPTKLNGEPVEVDTAISVVFTLGDSAPPAESQASPASAMDPQLRADILRLIEVSRLREREAEVTRGLFESKRPNLLAMIPPTPNREEILAAYGEKLESILQSQDFVDRVIAVYAKYLTDEDIKALIQFYQTPAGIHYLEVNSPMAIEISGIIHGLVQQNVGSIFNQLCHEYPELQGVAKFCPEGPTEKKSLLVEPRLPLAAPHAGD